jgi:hypothetical protein
VAKWIKCQTCHGGGKTTVWDSKKKTYVRGDCHGCGGKGKVNIGTV